MTSAIRNSDGEANARGSQRLRFTTRAAICIGPASPALRLPEGPGSWRDCAKARGRCQGRIPCRGGEVRRVKTVPRRGYRFDAPISPARQRALGGRALLTMHHGDNRGEMVVGARRLFEHASPSLLASRPPCRASLVTIERALTLDRRGVTRLVSGASIATSAGRGRTAPRRYCPPGRPPTRHGCPRAASAITSRSECIMVSPRHRERAREPGLTAPWRESSVVGLRGRVVAPPR
jgi:hypothetical protein